MESAWIPIALIVLVVINVWLMKIDLNFWKDLFTEKGKRHKKTKTDR